MKPANVLLSDDDTPVLMDFGSMGPARLEIKTSKEARALQVKWFSIKNNTNDYTTFQMCPFYLWKQRLHCTPCHMLGLCTSNTASPSHHHSIYEIFLQMELMILFLEFKVLISVLKVQKYY